jgi:hypothetical protein
MECKASKERKTNRAGLSLEPVQSMGAGQYHCGQKPCFHFCISPEKHEFRTSFPQFTLPRKEIQPFSRI